MRTEFGRRGDWWEFIARWRIMSTGFSGILPGWDDSAGGEVVGDQNTTGMPGGQKPGFGTEVRPQLNAPYHQHFFGARLI